MYVWFMYYVQTVSYLCNACFGTKLLNFARLTYTHEVKYGPIYDYLHYIFINSCTYTIYIGIAYMAINK